LARTGVRNGQFDQLKDFWSTRFLNLDGFHDKGKHEP
jgi:hypothetical protein